MARTRTDFQRELDGNVTAFFNQNELVRDFILQQIYELKAIIDSSGLKNHVKFFVKGGNSLIANKMAGGGSDQSPWSDWDTQLIINPMLEPHQWYEVYMLVHKVLLAQLVIIQKKWENFSNTASIQQLSVGSTRHMNPLTIDLGAQSNLLTTTGNTVVHALQSTDNANTLLQYLDKENEQAALDSLYPFCAMNDVFKTIAFNDFISSPVLDKNSWDALIRLQWIREIDNNTGLLVANELDYQHKDVKKLPYHDKCISQIDNVSKKLPSAKRSSIVVNTNISKFYLYRLIVRYDLKGIDAEGSPSVNSSTPLRGELIDISIPRRNTEEEINQWHQVNLLQVFYKKSFCFDIPDWEYHVRENVLMIVEVIEQKSGSPHKIGKRIERAFNAMQSMASTTNFQTAITERLKSLPQSYDPIIQCIISLGNNFEHVRIPLVWLMHSLEQSFRLSEINFNLGTLLNVVLDLKNRAMAAYQNIITTDQGKSIAAFISKQGNVSTQLVELIGTVGLIRELSVWQIAFSDEDWKFANKLIEMNSYLSFGPVLSACYKTSRLNASKIPSMPFPYMDVSANIPQGQDSNQFVQQFEQHLKSLQCNATRKDNRISVTRLGGLPVIIEVSNVQGMPVTTLDGVSILKDFYIIKTLDQKIAASHNSHITEWLDHLKKDFKKAIYTYRP